MSDVSSEARAGASEPRSVVERYGDHLLFLCILVLAIMLRLWNVRSEDAWFDEIATVKFLNEPTVSAYLESMQVHNPPVQPVYPVLQYYWFHWVQDSVVSLRLFSAMLIVPTLFFVRALGHRLVARSAGTFAAFVLAVSPIGIYYFQEVRMYSLTLLFSVASLYALLMLKSRRGRVFWWIANVLCTVAIIWTHILGVFFLLCQFLFVIAHFRRAGWRSVLLWVVLQGLAVASILPWLLNADHDYIRDQYAFRLTPSIFYEYLVTPRHSVQGLYTSWIGLGPHTQSNSLERLMLMGINSALYAVFFGALILLVYWTLSPLWKGRRPDGLTLANCILILSVATLPPFMLYLLSVIWEPSFFGRYVLISFVGLCLLPGVVIARIETKWLRRSLVSALGVCFLAQSVIYLQMPDRRSWTDLSEMIEEQSKPRARVHLYSYDPHLIKTEADFHLTSERIHSIIPYTSRDGLEDYLLRPLERVPPSFRTGRYEILVVIEPTIANELMVYFDERTIEYDMRTMRSRQALICFELRL